MTETDLSLNELCLACGLCCTNVVHRRVLLAADELPLAQKLGLRVMVFGEGPGFSLPCPQHRRGRCAVYEQRPLACVHYQCELLQRCWQGEVTIGSALALVMRARQVMVDKR
jgi:Fe-S-cluster containining protein